MRRLKQVIRTLVGRQPAPQPEPARFALWSIGLYAGPSPLSLAPHSQARNPIITRESVTDVAASFVADPFLYERAGLWHLYFEVLNRANGRGEIGLATSADLARWEYQRIVLAEPFHLSYPQVFEWEGEQYLLPEAKATSSIRLYKAQPFPDTWNHVHTLLAGEPFADSTIVRHEDRWWLFTQTSGKGKNDNLRLYYADNLLGSWTEHPASPIVVDNPHTARPGGSVITTPHGLLRFAQDCKPKYGSNVLAFEISRMTPTEYVERPATDGSLLGGTGTGWNASRMHHVDAHQLPGGGWIAAVDGAYNTTMADITGVASNGVNSNASSSVSSSVSRSASSQANGSASNDDGPGGDEPS